MPNCVDANSQRTLFLISAPHGKLEQIDQGRFLRQPEGAAQTPRPSCGVNRSVTTAVSLCLCLEMAKGEKERFFYDRAIAPAARSPGDSCSALLLFNTDLDRMSSRIYLQHLRVNFNVFIAVHHLKFPSFFLHN